MRARAVVGESRLKLDRNGVRRCADQLLKPGSRLRRHSSRGLARSVAGNPKRHDSTVTRLRTPTKSQESHRLLTLVTDMNVLDFEESVLAHRLWEARDARQARFHFTSRNDLALPDEEIICRGRGQSRIRTRSELEYGRPLGLRKQRSGGEHLSKLRSRHFEGGECLLAVREHLTNDQENSPNKARRENSISTHRASSPADSPCEFWAPLSFFALWYVQQLAMDTSQSQQRCID